MQNQNEVLIDSLKVEYSHISDSSLRACASIQESRLIRAGLCARLHWGCMQYPACTEADPTFAVGAAFNRDEKYGVRA